MATEDLSKLKIDKSLKTSQPVLRTRIKYFVIAFVLIAIAGLLYITGIITPAVSVEVVSVSQIYPSQTFTLLNASGYVVAQRKAAVASKITGRLVSLSVSEGSRVKKGQVIARLENEDADASREQAAANLNAARANVEQARAELKEASLTFERNKRLITNGSISQVEYENSETRYKKAKAAVDGAEATLKANSAALRGATVAQEYALIRAPFDAVVLTKNADIGDIITPLGAAANAKAAVVTIADMSYLEVEADVSESNLSLIKSGQPCLIQLDAFPDSRFNGVVKTIVPTADRSKASIMVKVGFMDNDTRILPEMSAKVAFLSRPVKSEEMKPRTALNRNAVINRNGKNVSFVVKGDEVTETMVTVGEQFGDMIEILSGLKAGDRVVLKPLEKLKTGTKIKVAEK
ncbi:MAG: efflux RND transporter periplasmic adaptor subunit [Deltaproteobacteria bacterium]|nr:efflux RND transporter periplasmic adaptor subunit [Deltaproteobacteria bacterium]